MLRYLAHIKDVIQGKVKLGQVRSSQWSRVRREHLNRYPTCAVCGGTNRLNVHHIKPYHLDPSIELSQLNLVTLCEYGKGGVNCHLFFGHLGNYKGFNKSVEADAEDFHEKIKQNKAFIWSSMNRVNDEKK